MAKEKPIGVYIPTLARDEVASLPAVALPNLTGKRVKVDISRLARGKLGELTCIIKEVKNNRADAEPARLHIFPSYIKRFVRRGISKIDESFFSASSEKIKLRVKPIFITRKKVKRSVETSLRKEAKNFIIKLFNEMTLKDIFSETIKGEVQKKLSKKLKKIYPLSFCEIKELKIVTAK